MKCDYVRELPLFNKTKQNPNSRKMDAKRKKKKNHKTKITNLPDDIISEILSYLPPKSLLQFKSICKHWPILISDPNFIKLHLNRSLEQDSLNILLTCSVEMMITHFYGMESNYLGQVNEIGVLKKFSHLIGSCNGILCFKNGRNLCLLNPSTREYKFIYIRKLFKNYETYAYGFGYDSVLDDYVVVRASMIKSGEESFFSVYSLKHALCIKTIHVLYIEFGSYELAVYWNGFLHWLVDIPGKKVIITFDTTKKVLRELSLPNIPAEELDIAFLTIGILGGQLCLFCQGYDVDDVWVLNSYSATDSWYKFCSKDKDGTDLMGMLFIFKKNGEIIGSKGLVLNEYDPKRESARDIPIQGIQDGHTVHSMMTYVPSLVSLNSGTYLDLAN